MLICTPAEVILIKNQRIILRLWSSCKSRALTFPECTAGSLKQCWSTCNIHETYYSHNGMRTELFGYHSYLCHSCVHKMKLCQHSPLVKSLIPVQQQHNQAQVFNFDSLPQIPQDRSTCSHPWDTFQLHLHPTPACRAQGLPVTQKHPSPCQNATGDSHPLSSSEIQSLQVPIKSLLDVRNTQHRELGAEQKSSWPTQNKSTSSQAT